VSALVARPTEQDRVQALQRTLYRAAKADPGRRFHALYDKIYRRDVLERAWDSVRRNGGAAGIDRITIADVERYGVPRLLEELAADLKAGRYRPLPARRALIDKPGKQEKRPLSIPSVRDRVVQTAVKTVLEPVFEADFLPCSFGFRPRRGVHDALQVLIEECWHGRRWVVETDIANCLGPASHYPLAVAEGVEQATIGLGDLDTQALSSPGADVDGAELAALDTLQHRLPGDPQRHGRLQHRQPSLGACSTNRPRSWSVMRIRHGAPGVSCSPAMNPSASHRCTVEGATPSSSAARVMVTGSPSGGVAGGW
jgi:hypothetical protein